MKKTVLRVLVALFLVTLASCETEPIDPVLAAQNPDDNNPGDDDDNTTEPGVFKVKYDGSTKTAATTQAVYNEEYLAISGIMPDGSFFQVTVPNPHVGTFEFAAQQPDPSSADGILAMAYMVPGEESGYVATPVWGEGGAEPGYVDTAKVIITEIDTENETVTGTFQFTGGRYIIDEVNSTEEEIVYEYQTKVFTNGEFTNVSYATQVAGPTDNVFTAKLDGATYTPTSVNAMSLMGNIMISATRGSSETMGLTIPATITQGTYNFNMLTYVGQYNASNSTSDIFSATDGVLTITSHDTANHHITGSFYFTATPFGGGTTSHEITNGTFDVNY